MANSGTHEAKGIMTQRQATAVLFDWDFTLAYTLRPDHAADERVLRLFQDAGIACTLESVGQARTSFQAAVQRGEIRGTGRLQKKRDILQFYRYLLNSLGHADTSQALAIRLYRAYATLPTFLYDDVLPALRRLQRENVPIGILSNHACSVRPVIESFLAAFVRPEHITISEEVGVHKPGKTIFRRAAARLRLPADHCCYVGDNLTVDAIGAVARGGYALGLWLDRHDQGSSRPLPEHVARITELGGVFDFI
jgi:FMN phosphatase YigB (HAD superfamily)